MEHPKEAVEAVAGSLWFESEGEGVHGLYEVQHYDGARGEYEAKATILLDIIAPMYREQAARVAEEYTGPAMKNSDYRLGVAYASRDIAAAIRKGE